jgi:hypothetical protein
MRDRFRILSLPVVLVLLAGCGSRSPSATAAQKTFTTPEDAVVELVDALKANDRARLDALFGPDDQKILSSGDPVADQQAREVFIAAYLERAELIPEDDGRTVLNIGNESWPVPIPIVKDGDRWRFDTVEAAKEILYRRVGRNELSTIAACRKFVEAEKEYAATGHDGKTKGVYAQKFISTAGKHDGLFWKSDDPNSSSPLGEFAAQAAEEGYRAPGNTPQAFHGYYYRILDGRGASSPGGARNYVANGEMRGGFAMIAYPANYKNSGVMTFMVDDRGKVYEKDLGMDTEKLAAAIRVFEPDSTWTESE